MVSKQPKLRRQKRIFKQVMPRAKQMNINIVTWGRWMKQSSRIPAKEHIISIDVSTLLFNIFFCK